MNKPLARNKFLSVLNYPKVSLLAHEWIDWTPFTTLLTVLVCFQREERTDRRREKDE